MDESRQRTDDTVRPGPVRCGRPDGPGARRAPHGDHDAAGEGRPAATGSGSAPTRTAPASRRTRTSSTSPTDFDELMRVRPRPTHPAVRHRPRRPGVGAAVAGPRPAADRRGEPLRHPGARPRGVPRRLHHVARHRLPRPARRGAPPSTRSWSSRWRARIGDDMRSVGVHQGLAPVLDVVARRSLGPHRGDRSARTRTSSAAVAHAPTCAGLRVGRDRRDAQALRRLLGVQRPAATSPRSRWELASSPTCILPPFEMAVREAGVRSVMHSYAEIDGVPAAADRRCSPDLLRDDVGVHGTVVADYFGIAFLQLLHGVAGRPRARPPALPRAGIDVELPDRHAYGQPLLAARRRRPSSTRRSSTGRSAGCSRRRRELGLLDPDWDPTPRRSAAVPHRWRRHRCRARGRSTSTPHESRAPRAAARRTGRRAAAQRRRRSR